MWGVTGFSVPTPQTSTLPRVLPGLWRLSSVPGSSLEARRSWAAASWVAVF